jgi:NAD(P)-dependent dehydrogenase (short-subunit alcohol dehydrogenase family)
LSLSRVFADEWSPRGVLVNAVTPGPVTTPLWMAQGGLADQAAAVAGVDRDTLLRHARPEFR